MKKYLLTIIVSLLVGFLLSFYMLKEYESVNIIPVFNVKETAYLVQQGVYSSMESMQENTSHLTDYIYSVIDNMYYVYIGISLESDNVNKIQEYYKSKDIKTIIKTTTISDNDLINSLRQYDMVLKETNEEETIKEIIKQTLSKYKEEG
mgnify:CR=1 FL=1